MAYTHGELMADQALGRKVAVAFAASICLAAAGLFVASELNAADTDDFFGTLVPTTVGLVGTFVWMKLNLNRWESGGRKY